MQTQEQRDKWRDANRQLSDDAYKIAMVSAWERLQQNGDASVRSAVALHRSAGMSTIPQRETSLRQIGHALRPILEAVGDCHDRMEMAGQLIALFYGRGPGARWTRETFTEELVAIHAVRWCETGFPTLTLTPKQCAALMLTDLSADDLLSLRAPWETFVLRLPNEFRATRHDGVELYPLRVCVEDMGDASNGRVWRIRTDLNRKCAHAVGTVTDLYGASSPVGGWDLGFDPSPLETSVERLVKLCHRALFCALSAMNDAPPLGRLRGAIQHSRAMGTSKDQPYTEYALGTPVIVDARPWVKMYVSSETERQRKVRWIVRGHWRMQAHGEDRIMRRRRWIEPHWKGPERGPVLLREHQLTDHVVMCTPVPEAEP